MQNEIEDGRSADADRLVGPSDLSRSASQPEALIPSAIDLALLAEASLRWRPTSTDRRGVGIDYAVEQETLVPESLRDVAHQMSSAAQSDDLDSFKDWLGSPFASAVREASYVKGHAFWMNAALTAWLWAASGCPGLVFAAQPEGQEHD